MTAPLLRDYETMLTPLNLVDACRRIEKLYGDVVSLYGEGKSQLKFGHNDLQGTAWAQVWHTGGMEVLPDDNLINTIVSTEVGDTQEVTVCGSVLVDGIFTEATHTIRLQGTTPVTFAGMARADRLVNMNGHDFAGAVTVYQGVAGTVHITVHLDAGLTDNQSLKAAFAVPDGTYWLLEQFSVSVEKKTVASVDFRLQIRNSGGVFRTQIPATSANTVASVVAPIKPILIIPPNTDVRVIAASTAAATGVAAWLNGRFAKVIGTV